MTLRGVTRSPENRTAGPNRGAVQPRTCEVTALQRDEDEETLWDQDVVSTVEEMKQQPGE
jgi:hypothetical protein